MRRLHTVARHSVWVVAAQEVPESRDDQTPRQRPTAETPSHPNRGEGCPKRPLDHRGGTPSRSSREFANEDVSCMRIQRVSFERFGGWPGWARNGDRVRR